MQREISGNRRIGQTYPLYTMAGFYIPVVFYSRDCGINNKVVENVLGIVGPLLRRGRKAEQNSQ
jgi:hypothetical protein